MTAQSDQALVEQAQNSPEAFVDLYDKYFQRIYRFVYLQTRDETLTKDIAAATFEKALRHIKRYQWRRVSFAAWLYRIARNEIGQHRRRQRLLTLFVNAGSRNETNSRDRKTEMIVQAGEQHDQLHMALNELSAKDREIIILRFFDELSSAEVAEILGVSTRNVYVRLHRALKRLQKELHAINGLGEMKTDVAY